MRNFRELHEWIEATELVKEVYLITKNFPNSERFGLISQINRAVISIPSNIAEGSAFELESHLLLSSDLNFITKENSDKTIYKIQLLQKRISSLIKYNLLNS